MASSSSSHPRNEQQDAFSAIEPHGKRRRVDESSRLFDVFINHRGPDCKETLAFKLYKSLEELKIRAYLDSEEKEFGDSFPSTIKNAIQSASVHIAIFSPGYAKSPWCLAELVLMLQSGAKIIPLFYGVKPSDLRHIEKGAYAEAFIKYEEKKRYMEKFDEWKEALHSVSFNTGHEISSDFNSSDCQNIVSAVQNEVQRKISLHVAKYPVGLHKLVKDFEKACFDKIVEDFERQCRTNKGGKGKAQIVGIFGMGGVGKTTLAKELFNRNLPQYKRACFLFDVREAYSNNRFPSLQSKLLKDLFQRDGLNFHCTEEGKSHIGDCIGRSNRLSFLIVIDDIDHVQQLDDLLIMQMLKMSVDSLVIATTRDVSVLINTGITTGYNLKGMDRDDARQLFCWHAFGQPYPAEHHENLVNSFLNVCGGLPLSLQVLGSHVHGRDQNYWRLELNKVSKTLPRDIHQRLQISFDALDHEEQQIFMDIACFFVDELKSIAMQVWEASGWSAQHAVETLKNKCLVQDSIKEGLWIRVGEDRSGWRMHDHLRDLGREMAKGANHPRRLWRPQDVHLKSELFLRLHESKGFQNVVAQTKYRCFHSTFDKRTGCRSTYFVGESEFSADTSMCLLWLKLEYEGFQEQGRLPSIPSWVPLQNLRFLIIRNLHLKTLWQSNVQAPTQLKELQIKDTYLEEFSDLSGVSNKKLQLTKLIELNISNCPVLQELSVVHLSCVEKLVLHNCDSLKTVSGLSDLSKLVELKITGCRTFEQLRLVGVNSLKCITVDYRSKPTHFELVNCKNLETLSGKFGSEKLASIIIRDCPKLELLPPFEISNNQNTLTIDGCGELNSLLLSQCLNLKILMIESDLAMLSISDCPELEELPFSTCQTCSAKISIVRCGKLQNITLPVKLVELEIEECRELRTVTAICDTSDCLELQDLSSVARLSCLKRITIRTCERLQTIQGIDDFHALESLHLFDCPELEKLPFSTCQTCLAKVSIVRCGRLQNIILPAKLVELEIEECRELRTVTAICDTSDCLELQDLSSVARLSCLKRITIRTCERLQTIQGIDDFHALESLHLFDCPELEKLPFSTCQTCLAKVSIVRCGRLQNITLPAKLVELEILECCLKRITIRTCEKLQTTQGIDDFHALESLHLFDCPELEELAFSTCQSCPAKISIVKCGKLQSITLPAKLVELEREKCRELRTVTAICDTSDCLELQDLSSVARLSCLKRITIWTCERLQTIQGIDDFHALESLHLFDCPELEKLPFSTCQTCLAEVSIVRCGRLQNITLPAKLVELEIEKCRELRTVTAICDTSDCLELQDLSSVARLSCLKRITIRTCERLQTIQGIDDFHALESLHLFDCPELEKLPFSTCQTCLAEVSIVRCGRLQNITLPAKLVELEILECCLKRITIRTCEKLQTTQGIDDFHALESLHLFDCPELEELAFSTCQSYPAKISIVKCGKLQSITLPAKLVELEIEKCRELRTVTAICDTSDCLELQDFSSVSRLSCLKCITIQYCEQLQTIQGIDDFHALESLHLIDCPKLEELPFSICQTYLAQIRIVSCGKLQNITLPTKLVELEIKGCGELRTVTAICDPSDCLELQDLSSVARLSCLKCITIEDCKELQIIQGIGELHALESLHLLDCPKLEELPFSTCQTCLAKISIVRCGKLQNITLPTKLVVLEIQECEELKTVTLVCDPSESLEIQELSSVARLSCVQRISIQACEELQIIQGIGELHALNLMQLSCCSNATIRNCIHMLKSLPSKLLVVIGRAVNGALSTLKSPLFSDADAAIEDIITPTIMAELSAVILCFVVGPNSCTLHDLILFFTCCDLDWWSGFRADCWWPLAQGEWLVTVVITDEDMLESCDDSLQKYGEVKYGKKVCIKKGEEWKTLPMLCTIIDRLY